jgi:hypothetical protein
VTLRFRNLRETCGWLKDRVSHAGPAGCVKTNKQTYQHTNFNLACIYDHVIFNLERNENLNKSEKKWLMIFNSLSKYSKDQLEKLDKAINICNLYYNNIRAKTKLQYEFDTLAAHNKNIPHFEANFNWKKFADSNTVIRAITAEKLKQDQLEREKNSENDTIDLLHMCDYYTFISRIRSHHTIKEGKTWHDREIVKARPQDKVLNELEQTGFQTNMALPRRYENDDHKSCV